MFLAPKPFVFGVTRAPRQTTDIYAPTGPDATFAGPRPTEPMRFPADARWVDRLERGYVKPRGHRQGRKGRTLRDHRSGA
ncbi:hypothetical protein [Planktothrix phage Pra-JY27]|nr:hypothetical protein [Planktothrix phage Pag-Yong1]WEV89272.1 hypothetical protein [Synechococcus phage MinM2]